MKPNTLGLTKRDVRRIQLAAEDMTDAGSPPSALVASTSRSASAPAGRATNSSGRILGEWAAAPCPIGR